MNTINVIIGDEHPNFREYIKKFIEFDASKKVVALAANGEEILKKLEKVDCDLLVIDLSMPKLDDFTILDILSNKYPNLKTLILSGHKEKAYIRESQRKGACGFVNKNDFFLKFDLAINIILSGKKYFDI